MTDDISDRHFADRALARLPAVAPSPGFEAALLAAYDAWKAERAKGRWAALEGGLAPFLAKPSGRARRSGRRRRPWRRRCWWASALGAALPAMSECEPPGFSLEQTASFSLLRSDAQEEDLVMADPMPLRAQPHPHHADGDVAVPECGLIALILVGIGRVGGGFIAQPGVMAPAQIARGLPPEQREKILDIVAAHRDAMRETPPGRAAGAAGGVSRLRRAGLFAGDFTRALDAGARRRRGAGRRSGGAAAGCGQHA